MILAVVSHTVILSGKSTTINALKRLSLLASKTRYDSRDSMIGVSRAQAR